MTTRSTRRLASVTRGGPRTLRIFRSHLKLASADLGTSGCKVLRRQTETRDTKEPTRSNGERIAREGWLLAPCVGRPTPTIAHPSIGSIIVQLGDIRTLSKCEGVTRNRGPARARSIPECSPTPPLRGGEGKRAKPSVGTRGVEDKDGLQRLQHVDRSKRSGRGFRGPTRGRAAQQGTCLRRQPSWILCPRWWKKRGLAARGLAVRGGDAHSAGESCFCGAWQKCYAG